MRWREVDKDARYQPLPPHAIHMCAHTYKQIICFSLWSLHHTCFAGVDEVASECISIEQPRSGKVEELVRSLPPGLHSSTLAFPYRGWLFSTWSLEWEQWELICEIFQSVKNLNLCIFFFCNRFDICNCCSQALLLHVSSKCFRHIDRRIVRMGLTTGDTHFLEN